MLISDSLYCNFSLIRKVSNYITSLSFTLSIYTQIGNLQVVMVASRAQSTSTISRAQELGNSMECDMRLVGPWSSQMMTVSISKHRREGTDSPPGSCLSFSFSNMARSFRPAPLLQSSDVPKWSFSHTDFVLFFFFVSKSCSIHKGACSLALYMYSKISEK